jgi:hypothetical protein
MEQIPFALPCIIDHNDIRVKYKNEFTSLEQIADGAYMGVDGCVLLYIAPRWPTEVEGEVLPPAK